MDMFVKMELVYSMSDILNILSGAWQILAVSPAYLGRYLWNGMMWYRKRQVTRPGKLTVKAVEGAIEIVDLPIDSMVIFQFVM